MTWFESLNEFLKIPIITFLLAVVAAMGWHAGRLLAASLFGPLSIGASLGTVSIKVIDQTSDTRTGKAATDE